MMNMGLDEKKENEVQGMIEEKFYFEQSKCPTSNSKHK